MGRTGKPLGRTEALIPPLEPRERDLAQGKGPGEPGINRFRKKWKCVRFYIFVVFFDCWGISRNDIHFSGIKS